MVHCDRKFEKFDKILIREASSALIPCISSFFYNSFLWYLNAGMNLIRDVMEKIRNVSYS